jgi:superfamily II DNA/RNA helicase
VATPGRLLDVIATKQQQEQTNSQKNKGLSLERTTMVVLDECDRLLHMGFANQVTQILQNIRPDRQTLMLSATMSRRIETVAQEWLSGGGKSGIGHATTDYVRIAVGRTGQSSLHVQQHVMVVPDEAAKLSWLQQMLPVLCGVGRTLVFSATKDGCEKLASELQLGDEITCITLHGDKHQTDRNAALRKFIKQQKVILIATDVASRGLDIPQVTTVVNYDPPKNLDVHVHRVGRAGRLSANKNGEEEQQPKEGTAYTLLRTPKDADIGHVLLGALEREDRPIPDELRALAKLSRQQRGGSGSNAPTNQSRSHGNKSGLGANKSDYGSASYAASESPAQKKSRWS